VWCVSFFNTNPRDQLERMSPNWSFYTGWIETQLSYCVSVWPLTSYQCMVCTFVFVGGLCRYKNRSVLSYHYYCWLIDPERVYEHYKLWERVVCDDILGPLVMKVFVFTCVMYAIRGERFVLCLCILFVCRKSVFIKIERIGLFFVTEATFGLLYTLFEGNADISRNVDTSLWVCLELWT